MKSYFTNKLEIPTEIQLEAALSDTYLIWKQLEVYTMKLFPSAITEWHYSSEKFGWSFRIKDKKRVLIYLLPRDKFFKVAFVFGQKATNEIMIQDLAESIKNELQSAKIYAEGRGIRIAIVNENLIADILKLIAIKINH